MDRTNYNKRNKNWSAYNIDPLLKQSLAKDVEKWNSHCKKREDIREMEELEEKKWIEPNIYHPDCEHCWMQGSGCFMDPSEHSLSIMGF